MFGQKDNIEKTYPNEDKIRRTRTLLHGSVNSWDTARTTVYATGYTLPLSPADYLL